MTSIRPNSVGTVPVNLLYDKSSSVSIGKLPSSVGMWPLKVHPFILNHASILVMEPSSVGMWPPKFIFLVVEWWGEEVGEVRDTSGGEAANGCRNAGAGARGVVRNHSAPNSPFESELVSYLSELA